MEVFLSTRYFTTERMLYVVYKRTNWKIEIEVFSKEGNVRSICYLFIHTHHIYILVKKEKE